MSDRRIVEVEKAPCRHLHAANYDPAKVVRGQPVEVIGSGRMWCFDCERFFTYPPPLPKSYTLDELEQLAKQWRDESEANDAQWVVSHLLAWLKRKERDEADN